MKRNPSKNLRDKKPDLSPFLFHFTSGDNAFDNIISIVNDKKLICKMNIEEYRKSICFTESPLSLSIAVFDYMYSYSTPCFSKYGIGFKRDVLVRSCGARPVIYGDGDEYNLLPKELKWRFEALDVEIRDWQWLREWRIKGKVFDFSQISLEDIIIIAPTKDDLKKIVAYSEFEEFDFDVDHGVCVPYPIYKLSREWKGISFEELSFINNDTELEKLTDLQEIGEKVE